MTRSVTAVRESRPAFELFEGYALASVLASLEMAGVLSDLEDGGMTAAKVADRGEDEAALLTASLRYLAHRGMVAEDDAGTFTLTEEGAAVCADRGYLVWLVGGYGEPLRRLDAFLAHGKRYGVDYPRDGRWVADGAAILGKKDVVPDAMRLLERLSFDNVLDLGCGNARFLISVCQRFGAGGIGVDLSPAACAQAEKAVAEAGLEDRITVVLGDAGDLAGIETIGDVQLVVTFFLLHEILAGGRDVLVGYLAGMSKALPPGANLLIAEVEPPTGDGGPDQPFTPEFTYVHAMMRQVLLGPDDWSAVLREGGFTVREVLRTTMPGCILLLAENTGV